MKIGVISDTHIPVFANKLSEEVTARLKECDIIVHAGDIVESRAIKEIGKIAEVKAVCGNMDSPELKHTLPEKLIFEASGKKIGVTHGKGASFKVIQYVEEAFTQKLDIVIFGHSHMPFNEERGGTLYFNPGSATDNVFAKHRSFGIIEIDGDDIRAQIIEIKG